MKKNTVLSLIVAGVIVGGAVMVRQNGSQTRSNLTPVTNAELVQANGKDGKKCWLAVDGVVYEIEQGFKWVEGQHSESSLAYCGADMSKVIDQAPHGRTKLTQLKKVGHL